MPDTPKSQNTVRRKRKIGTGRLTKKTQTNKKGEKSRMSILEKEIARMGVEERHRWGAIWCRQDLVETSHMLWPPLQQWLFQGAGSRRCRGWSLPPAGRAGAGGPAAEPGCACRLLRQQRFSKWGESQEAAHSPGFTELCGCLSKTFNKSSQCSLCSMMSPEKINGNVLYWGQKGSGCSLPGMLFLF